MTPSSSMPNQTPKSRHVDASRQGRTTPKPKPRKARGPKEAATEKENLNPSDEAQQLPRRSVAFQFRAAVHEAGHAVAAYSLLGPEALNRISAIPSGEPDDAHHGRFELRDEWIETHATTSHTWQHLLIIGHAGMVAEELVIGSFMPRSVRLWLESAELDLSRSELVAAEAADSGGAFDRLSAVRAYLGVPSCVLHILWRRYL
jgi:hypothetical protein